MRRLAKRVMFMLVFGIACSAVDQVFPIPCAWVYVGDHQLPATNGCWLLEPPPGVSFMEPGAGACDADDGTGERLWPSGGTVELWSRMSTTGSPRVVPVAAPCPENPHL